jgi:heme/copper-type cytochrome/quinol oxidase subunit 2
LSPLSNFFKTTIFMKLLSIVILVYTMYLNLIQTNYLRNASNSTKAENVKSQLTINIFCSYIFTLFLGLLAIFVIKSFF